MIKETKELIVKWITIYILYIYINYVIKCVCVCMYIDIYFTVFIL